MNNNNIFKFKTFSKKQKKLLFWWDESISPYANCDMVIADGAVRSGKTIAMICSFMMWSCKKYKGENFIVAGNSIGTLKRNVIDPLLQIISAWGWSYEEKSQPHHHLIIGGNKYYLFGANNEKSFKPLQGLTAAGSLCDEIALFPENFVKMMETRCSIEGSKIFCNCNPNNPYHYFKLDYIDKQKQKNIYYLHFDMDDNLTLSVKIKDKFKKSFAGVFYQRYILGKWVIAEGLIYSVFNKDKHVVICKNEQYSSYYLSVDYGIQNPFAMCLMAYKNSTWYMVSEYYHDGRKDGQKTDDEYYKDLEEFIGKRYLQQIIIDPSAASFITLIVKNGKYGVIKAKNDVLNGIRVTSQMINTNKLLFDVSCKNMFMELHTYAWDEKAVERGEDKPIKQNDHLCDAIRYFVYTLYKYGKISL